MVQSIDAVPQVAPGEIKEIINAYNDKNDVKAVQSNGLHVGGERFVVLKADQRSLYARKVTLPMIDEGHTKSRWLIDHRHRARKGSSLSERERHYSSLIMARECNLVRPRIQWSN